MTDLVAVREVLEVSSILRSGSAADFEFVRSLVDEFPDGVDAWFGQRWIAIAIENGSPEAVRWMLRHGVDLTFKDTEGFTVLHRAIERRDAVGNEMLSALIAAGADVNVHGFNGWTPLHMAVARGNLEAVKLLLEGGANPSIRMRIDQYATATELAGPKIARFIRDFRRCPANWRRKR